MLGLWWRKMISPSALADMLRLEADPRHDPVLSVSPGVNAGSSSFPSLPSEPV